MWPTESIIQSMRPAMVCRCPTSVVEKCKNSVIFSHLAKSLMLLFLWDFSILASNKLLMGNAVMYCSIFLALLLNNIFDVAFLGFVNNFSLK